MSTITPESLLNTKQTADALTEAGYATRPSSLDTWASRPGTYGGPPYVKYGQRRLYRWADALAWAQAKAGPARRNTSELTEADA